jgi:hypothetical protein
MTGTGHEHHAHVKQEVDIQYFNVQYWNFPRQTPENHKQLGRAIAQRIFEALQYIYKFKSIILTSTMTWIFLNEYESWQQ